MSDDQKQEALITVGPWRPIKEVMQERREQEQQAKAKPEGKASPTNMSSRKTHKLAQRPAWAARNGPVFEFDGDGDLVWFASPSSMSRRSSPRSSEP